MLKLDPFSLDRTLARFAGQHARFLTSLAEGEGVDHVFERRPAELDAELLRELRDAGDRDPLAASLERWAAFLLLEHACAPPELRAAQALHKVSYPLDQPERGSFTLAQMRRRALIDAPRRKGWLAALEAHAQLLQTRRFELFERRAERAVALGVSQPAPLEALPRAVEGCLEQTADPYAELEARSFSRLLELGLGRDVPGAYPTRLSLRALGDLFREGGWLSGLEPRLDRVPEVWGVSSFLRALRSFGSALHDAGASTRQPFVVARDPYGARSALFGNLFALLLLNPAFAARRLEVGRARFVDYRRSLGALVLLGVRVDCVRSLLAAASPLGTSSYRQAFRECVPAAFGFELPPALVGVLWVDSAAPHRVAGLLAALSKNAELTEAHDEDWFRNPRAVEELRAEFESPPSPEPAKQQLERGLSLLGQTLNH